MNSIINSFSKIFFFTLLLNLFITNLVSSQIRTVHTSKNFTNLRVSSDLDTVIITYDIVGCLPDDVLGIDLLVSENAGIDFNIDPAKLTGDIGSHIEPGNTKTIKWMPLDEDIELNGENYVFLIEGWVLGSTSFPEFVKIKGGTFTMGDRNHEGLSDANKLHEVNLDDFEISSYEITNNQFYHFIKSYGSTEVKSGEFKGEPLFYEHSDGLIKEQLGKIVNWRPHLEKIIIHRLM